jgi:hypothetical protein
MKLFKRLLGKQPKPPSPGEQATAILHRFTTATIMGVDREDLGRYPLKQRKVMAFHYGAIRCLAREFELDETETLAVFVMFVNKYFNLPVSETGSISERLQGFHDNPEERDYLEAGEDVFRRWHEQGERRAPLELGEMLRA